MRFLGFGGLTLGLVLTASFGVAAYADDDKNNNGLPPPASGPGGSSASGASNGTNGGTAPNGGTNGGTTNGGTTNGGTTNGGTTNGGTTNGGTNGNNGTTPPPATRLTPAVENAIAGRRTVGDRIRGVARDAFDPAQSGSFIGGIMVSDLSQAAWNGIKGDPTAIDQVGDAGHALTTPEFYAGVGMFNLVYARGERLVGQKLGMDLIAKAGAEEGAGMGAKALGAAGGFLKENVVLALALTIPRLVQVDFGGFNLWSATKDVVGMTPVGMAWHAGKDIVTGHFGNILHDVFHPFSSFGSEVSKLTGTRVHSSFKFDKQHFEDLGITLGSFMAAKPIWTAIKVIGKTAIKKFLIRQAAVAPAEIAAAAIPGEDVIGIPADAVVEVGLAAWTIWDIAVAAVDLGGLLLTANAIQKPLQNWNDHRQFQDAAKKATDNYLAVSKEHGGNPDPKKLQDAMAQLATAMADLRDYEYLPVAIEDAKFVDRLKRQGVSQDEINKLAGQVMQQDGAWLAASGQTAALDAAFAPNSKHAGVTNQGDFNGVAQRHQDLVAHLVDGIENQPRVDKTHLDPANKDFEFSRNRDQLYDEEIAILARGGQNLKDPALQQKVLQDMQIVGGLAEAEKGLLKPVQSKTPGLAAALGGATGN